MSRKGASSPILDTMDVLLASQDGVLRKVFTSTPPSAAAQREIERIKFAHSISDSESHSDSSHYSTASATSYSDASEPQVDRDDDTPTRDSFAQHWSNPLPSPPTHQSPLPSPLSLCQELLDRSRPLPPLPPVASSAPSAQLVRKKRALMLPRLNFGSKQSDTCQTSAPSRTNAVFEDQYSSTTPTSAKKSPLRRLSQQLSFSTLSPVRPQSARHPRRFPTLEEMDAMHATERDSDSDSRANRRRSRTISGAVKVVAPMSAKQSPLRRLSSQFNLSISPVRPQSARHARRFPTLEEMDSMHAGRKDDDSDVRANRRRSRTISETVKTIRGGFVLPLLVSPVEWTKQRMSPSPSPLRSARLGILPTLKTEEAPPPTVSIKLAPSSAWRLGSKRRAERKRTTAATELFAEMAMAFASPAIVTPPLLPPTRPPIIHSRSATPSCAPSAWTASTQTHSPPPPARRLLPRSQSQASLRTLYEQSVKLLPPSPSKANAKPLPAVHVDRIDTYRACGLSAHKSLRLTPLVPPLRLMSPPPTPAVPVFHAFPLKHELKRAWAYESCATPTQATARSTGTPPPAMPLHSGMPSATTDAPPTLAKVTVMSPIHDGPWSSIEALSLDCTLTAVPTYSSSSSTSTSSSSSASYSRYLHAAGWPQTPSLHYYPHDQSEESGDLEPRSHFSSDSMLVYSADPGDKDSVTVGDKRSFKHSVLRSVRSVASVLYTVA